MKNKLPIKRIKRRWNLLDSTERIDARKLNFLSLSISLSLSFSCLIAGPRNLNVRVYKEADGQRARVWKKIPADSNVSPNADENRTHGTAARCKWRRKFVSVIARRVSRRHFSMHCQNESLSTGSITYFLNRASRLTALPRSEISTNRRARNRKKKGKEERKKERNFAVIRLLGIADPRIYDGDDTTSYYGYRIENPSLLLIISRFVVAINPTNLLKSNLDFLSDVEITNFIIKICIPLRSTRK